MLGLVYDFFEDSRVERIDELTAEYEKLSSEQIDGYKKDPYAVLCPNSLIGHQPFWARPCQS